MQSRQFYASISASGSAYFDMPKNSRIRGVCWHTNAPNSAVTDSLIADLTLVSTGALTTTDAQNVIAGVAFTGGANGGNGNFYSPCDIAVKAGDRIYWNYTESGTATWGTRVIVWFD